MTNSQTMIIMTNSMIMINMTNLKIKSISKIKAMLMTTMTMFTNKPIMMAMRNCIIMIKIT